MWACSLTLALCAGCGAPVAPGDAGQPAAAPADGGSPRADGGGAHADGGLSADDGGPFDAGTISTVADGGDGGFPSFEACCAAMGCADGGAMAHCSSYPSTYGTCSVNNVAGICIDTTECTGGWAPTAGHCPGPANIQCCHPASAAMLACTADDHPLPNRGIAPVSFDNRCSDGMRVVANAFCVDVYEAFLVEILPDGGTGDWSPYFNPGTRTMRALSAEGAVPQGYINANQAEAACENAGKRLCTNTEWLRACRGPDNTTYPYGNTREPGVCNDARAVHPAVEYFGTSDPSVYSLIQHPCLNQLPNSLDPAGSRAGCETAEGLFDMMGNLHEWTSDPAGTFRGGYYVDTVINGPGCLYVTTAHDRSHWDYSTGFRCCADLR
jgi:hypothetical protein